MKKILVPLIAALFSTAAWGNLITIGLPATSLNLVPFSRPLNATTACTRYQQAYAAADFSGLGPITISGFSFLGGNGGNFAPGTYSFYFSTISRGIDALSNTAFDANLGADNAAFTSVYLSGASPINLTFSGMPFTYNPTNGNLLLDVIISQDGPMPLGRLASYELDGNAPGIFSRYDNFATGNSGYGLVTEFDYTPVPDPVNTLAGLSLAAGLLWSFKTSQRR